MIPLRAGAPWAVHTCPRLEPGIGSLSGNSTKACKLVLICRSSYVWLFQAPLLPELLIKAHDLKVMNMWNGQHFGLS